MHSRPLLPVFVAFLVLMPSAAMGETENRSRIQVAHGEAVFTQIDGKLSLAALETKIEGRTRSWIVQGAAVPIWTLVLHDVEGNRFDISSKDGQATILSSTDEGLTAEWSGLNPGNVRVTMKVSPRGADLLFALQSEIQSDRYGLWSVTYPEIGPISELEEVQSILPKGWGVVRGGLMDRPIHENVYPSGGGFSMPFVALSDREAGVYAGVEDASGYAVRLFVGRRNDEKGVSFGLRHEVEGMGAAKRFHTSYDAVVTPFQGSWYEAARLYRIAATKTDWGGVPPLAERQDVPEWMKETDLWYVGACHDVESASKIIQFAEFFGVPTSAHVYGWHEIPFDDHYPEYFPAKPGFKDAVQKVQAAGVHVMPYINGRLWDSRTDSWTKENARNACSLDVNGNPYYEVYGSGVPLSPMCPSTLLWQNTVTTLVDRLTNEVGVDAVYIDQISAAEAKRCFSKEHGHPVGGGTYWIQGYRELLRQCLGVLRPGAGLTTEENADPWNDQLHAFLMVNTRPNGGEIVPIYPAVYGGRVISFGFQYFLGEDYTYRYPLRLKFAQTFTYGSQLGWIGSEILQDAYRTEAKYLKKLCTLRHLNRDALQYGELLAPLEIQDGGVVSWETEAKGPGTRIEEKAVLASLWLTPEGKRKLAITNVADDERIVRLGLDDRHVGRCDRDILSLRQSGCDGMYDLKKEDSGEYRGEVALRPLDAMILEVE